MQHCRQPNLACLHANATEKHWHIRHKSYNIVSVRVESYCNLPSPRIIRCWTRTTRRTMRMQTRAQIAQITSIGWRVRKYFTYYHEYTRVQTCTIHVYRTRPHAQSSRSIAQVHHYLCVCSPTNARVVSKIWYTHKTRAHEITPSLPPSECVIKQIII